MYAPTWVTFEDITLSETSQSQKDKYYTIPLIQVPSHQIGRDRKQNGGCQRLGGGGEGNERLFSGDRVSVLCNEKSRGSGWW